MTKDQALKLALKALKKCRYRSLADEIVDPAITALREALAQPEQEPVERECKSGGLNVYWYATHGMIQVTFE